jgi:hypothetical protein
MLKLRSRRFAIVVAAAAALPLLGVGTAQVGHIPAKGLAPLCLLSPGSPDCKDGVIS